MGWPNNDPEGWAEVERVAVANWAVARLQEFYGTRNETLGSMIVWLQAEEPEIFQVMVEQTGTALGDAEADYLERKFSTGG